MAVAFFIPDQASLLRKAIEQERQILRKRETHWRFIASVVMDALRYVDPAPSCMSRCASKVKLHKLMN